MTKAEFVQALQRNGKSPEEAELTAKRVLALIDYRRSEIQEQIAALQSQLTTLEYSGFRGVYEETQTKTHQA